LVFLYVGRLSWEKDLFVLQGAMEELNKKYKDRIGLLITGDGPMKKELENNMPDNIAFTGYKTGIELAQIYASADLFTFPSSFETFGNVVLEAAASGIPTVGVAMGGVLNIIDHGKTGLLAKPKDIESFTTCIDQCINNDILRLRMGSTAREYAKLEMIWLGLSCGPIGIGDAIGKENTELLERVANADGQIIKPDRPCEPLDQCFLYNPYSLETTKGITVFTYSCIEGIDECIYYALTLNMHPHRKKVQMSYSVSEFEPMSEEKKYLVYNYFSKEYMIISSKQDVLYQMQGKTFYYHILSPIIDGMAIIGDISKHVTASHQRIKKVECTDLMIIVHLASSRSNEKACFSIYMEKEPYSVSVKKQGSSYTYEKNILTIETWLGQKENRIVIKKFEYIRIQEYNRWKD